MGGVVGADGSVHPRMNSRLLAADHLLDHLRHFPAGDFVRLVGIMLGPRPLSPLLQSLPRLQGLRASTSTYIFTWACVGECACVGVRVWACIYVTACVGVCPRTVVACAWKKQRGENGEQVIRELVDTEERKIINMIYDWKKNGGKNTLTFRNL